MRPSAVKIFCLFRLLSVKKAVSYFFLTVVDRPYLCRYEVQAQNELYLFFIICEFQTRLIWTLPPQGKRSGTVRDAAKKFGTGIAAALGRFVESRVRESPFLRKVMNVLLVLEEEKGHREIQVGV